MSNFVKIGDNVMWRGCFGTQAPVTAKVISMQITDSPWEKYGESVEKVNWSIVNKNRVIFTLDNGHWAYSDQISKIS